MRYKQPIANWHARETRKRDTGRMACAKRSYPTDLGRRIVVYGPSGSGKSTLARTLGERLGLPVIELDALYHLPGWGIPTAEAFRGKVTAALAAAADGWIVDGNYSDVRDLVLADAESAVWVRLPFHVVFPRLIRRTVRRSRTHEIVCGENTETFRKALTKRDSILLWGITGWRPHHRKTRAALRSRRDGVRVVVLRTPAEVRDFVASLPPGSPAATPPPPAA
jgi:adenylate kinase family enzyme